VTPVATRFTAAASLAAIAAINLLVVAKYAPRAHVSGAALGAAYVAAVAAAAACARRFGPVPAKWRRIVPALAVAVAVVLLFAVLEHVRPESVRVTRWSAITAFNDRLLSGRFPYEARAHLGDRVSGLPVLFVVALPFQVVGDVGYLQLFVVAAFAAAILWRWGRDHDLLWPLLLLLTSPAFLWEVVARSDLMSNAMLVVLVLCSCERWRGQLSPRRIAVIAALAGLCASTRLSLVVPMVVYFVGYFRQDWRASLQAAAGAAAVFAATLLPFALWDWNAFVANNPLAWQASLSAWPIQAAAAAAAVLVGRAARDLGTAAYLGGMVTLAAVTGAFVLAGLGLGWDRALWGSGFDISYFDLALPFLLVPLLFTRPVRGGGAATVEVGG
jgi:hypothetical protein